MARKSRDKALPDALAPARDSLLRAAREEAAATLARADEAASEVLQQAQAGADEIRAEARARGEADSAEFAAAQRSRVGRQARSIVLAARTEEYQALHAAAREAVARLVDDPQYQPVRERMAAMVRELLGERSEIRDAPGGGVIGIAPGRRADFTLSRLVARAIDDVLADTPSPSIKGEFEENDLYPTELALDQREEGNKEEGEEQARWLR